MTLVDARVAPTRAPGLELLGPLEDSGYHDPPSLVRRPDGQLIQLTPLLYALVEAVDGERGLDQLAEEVSRRTGRSVAPEDVELLIDKRLEPLGILCAADGTPPPAREQAPLLALRWKVVVTDPAVTRRITAPFAALFKPWIVMPVLVGFVATTWWVLFRHGLASGTRQAFTSPGLMLVAFALIVVSAGWHEFGHAAACRSAGATPGAMGAGVYMVWPAFYTDVDDSRRLGRWGRLKVDLGGLYFNAVAAVAVMAVWLAVRADALLVVVAAQLLLMVRQLAPVIRADGYHILADLSGVPDLYQHMRPTLAGMLPSNWGKPQPLRRWARWTVRAWVFIVGPMLLWMFLVAVLFLPRLVATAWVGLREQGRSFLESAGDVDALGMAAASLKAASLMLPVAAGAYLLFRVVRRTSRRLWRATDGRPLARRALVAGTVMLLLLLTLAWWPAGQYQPVSAAEKGTLQELLHMRTPQQAAAVKPLAGVQPVSGYALVPRDKSLPTVLFAKAGDGSLRAIVTEDDGTGVAFPFTLPPPPGPGDNQALAVNTADGTVVYDVSVALVWVTDGEPVDNHNEAFAAASCTGCTTVAVAFQVVLVVGQSDAVTPVNTAVAVNSGCLSCTTAALAVQLVVTLTEMPSEELQAQIEQALADLDAELADLDDLGEVYAAIKEVEAEITELLYDAGLVAEPPASEVADDESSATTSTSTSSTSTSTTTSTSTSTTSTSTSTTTSTTSTTTTTDTSTVQP